MFDEAKVKETKMITDILFNTIFIVIKGNRDFFKIIDDFHNRMPPQHKGAKEIADASLIMTVVDTTKMNLTSEDLDLFHKKLENFNYDRIIFRKKRIISFSKNLQRLLRITAWDKFTVSIIQSLLEDESHKDGIPNLFGYRIGKVIGC